MASRLGRLVARTLLQPVWVAGPPHVETWVCPTCGREVVRRSPAVKGIWVAPTALERTALCARQHGAHDRHGSAPADDGAAAADDEWLPVVALEDGAFLALVPPAGLRCTPAPGGGYEVAALDHVAPSDLVGRAPTASRTGPEMATTSRRRLAEEAVRFDDSGRPVAVATAQLPRPRHPSSSR